MENHRMNSYVRALGVMGKTYNIHESEVLKEQMAAMAPQPEGPPMGPPGGGGPGGEMGPEEKQKMIMMLMMKIKELQGEGGPGAGGPPMGGLGESKEPTDERKEAADRADEEKRQKKEGKKGEAHETEELEKEEDKELSKESVSKNDVLGYLIREGMATNPVSAEAMFNHMSDPFLVNIENHIISQRLSEEGPAYPVETKAQAQAQSDHRKGKSSAGLKTGKNPGTEKGSGYNRQD